MEQVLTVEQMRKADEYTIESLFIPSLTLMERAGGALANAAQKQGKEVLCVCGGGNNGGDGFVCARLLIERGIKTTVFCSAEKFSVDCSKVKELYERAGGVIVKEFPNFVPVVVDCLLGTGFQGKVREQTQQEIAKINAYKQMGAYVISADIPSGLNGDNGVKETCVFASETVAIGEYKFGHFLNDGIDVCGNLVKADIGISLMEEKYALLIDDTFLRPIFKKRMRNTHKGSYGNCLILGGSKGYTGAPYLSALAALKGGAGYVTLAVPKGIAPYYYLRAPELLIKETDGQECIRFHEKTFREYLVSSSIAYGMGAGISQDVYEGVKFLIKNYQGKLILDADALNSIAAYSDNYAALFENKKCEVIITPHAKEFARLCKKDTKTVLENGVQFAKEFAKAYGITVLLKGATTVITDGERTALSNVGSAGQAKGGSGDVLAGLIASIAAQGNSLFDSGSSAAYLCGSSAYLCEKELGEYSFTPSDVIAKIPFAILNLFQSNKTE